MTNRLLAVLLIFSTVASSSFAQFAQFPPIKCNDSDPTLCPNINKTECSNPFNNYSVAKTCAKSCGCCDAKTCNDAFCNGHGANSCCFDDHAMCKFINLASCRNSTVAQLCQRTCGEAVDCCGGVTNQCNTTNGMECCSGDQSCQSSGSSRSGVPYSGGCCTSDNWCSGAEGGGGCCDGLGDCCEGDCCDSDKPRCFQAGQETSCVECLNDVDCTSQQVCVQNGYNDENFCADCYTDDQGRSFGCGGILSVCIQETYCDECYIDDGTTYGCDDRLSQCLSDLDQHTYSSYCDFPATEITSISSGVVHTMNNTMNGGYGNTVGDKVSIESAEGKKCTATGTFVVMEVHQTGVAPNITGSFTLNSSALHVNDSTLCTVVNAWMKKYAQRLP